MEAQKPVVGRVSRGGERERSSIHALFSSHSAMPVQPRVCLPVAASGPQP